MTWLIPAYPQSCVRDTAQNKKKSFQSLVSPPWTSTRWWRTEDILLIFSFDLDSKRFQRFPPPAPCGFYFLCNYFLCVCVCVKQLRQDLSFMKLSDNFNLKKVLCLEHSVKKYQLLNIYFLSTTCPSYKSWLAMFGMQGRM